MFKYKSHCRFNLLIALPDKILEVRPGEIVESEVEIAHPNLYFIKEEKINKVKQNADKTTNG
jgi:hypothetical protein